MRILLHKHSAQLLTLLRVILVFVAIILMSADAFALRICGLYLVTLAAFLDGVDGYVARRLNISSPLGGVIDILGDRITENVLFVFFACKNTLPLYVPLIFLTRSFLADFVRSVNYHNGIAPFRGHPSRLGQFLVASSFARSLYLTTKFGLFLTAGLLVAGGEREFPIGTVYFLQQSVLWLSGITVTFCILRFILLAHDSRKTLIREFQK